MDVRHAGRMRPITRQAAVIRLGALGIGAALAITALTGCAAGQRAQTSSERAVIDGVDAQVGALILSDVTVAAPSSGTSYPKGGTAPLELVIVNQGKSGDALTSVTTSAAQSAIVSPTPIAAPSASPTSSDLTSPDSTSPDATSPDSTSPGATSSEPASSEPASSDSASSASDSPTPSSPITVPIGGSVRIGESGSGAQVLLQDLTGPLFPAQQITLHFTFRSGLTLDVATTVSTVEGDTSAPTLAVAPSEVQ